jgi:pyruvate/2-oxoglutarate/acetoin dehydrogenase E1 component
VTIVAHSRSVGLSLEAASELEKEGISAEVENTLDSHNSGY